MSVHVWVAGNKMLITELLTVILLLLTISREIRGWRMYSIERKKLHKTP